MDLYTKLAEIFEISDLNLDRSNRRTLLKYAKRTKFQKRREAFYSVCDEGTKSKVAICKTDERPSWVDNLETLKTKQLRGQLKGFLKELGVLENPKYANLKKLAREKNWHHVIYLDDETKMGAGPSDEEAEVDVGDVLGRGGPPSSPPGTGIRAARDRQARENRTSPIKRSRHRRRARKAGATVPRLIIEAGDRPSKQGWVDETRVNYTKQGWVDHMEHLHGLRGANVGAQADFRAHHGAQPIHQQIETAVDASLDRRSRDSRLARVERLLLKGRSRNEEAERIRDATRPLLDQLQEQRLEKSDVIVRDDPTFEIGGGDGHDLAREPRIQVINTGNRTCVFTQEDEECVCKPHTVKFRDMTSETKTRLKDLAEQKAIACSKIDLLRCLGVEYTQQMKLWKKFNENCQGDFLAKFTAHQVKELTCGKYPVFSGPDLHTMKAVAQCFAASKNLCKGHSDVMARFEDPKAINKEYTMGHLCYDDVLAGVRKFGDPWYKAAFRNRKPDPVPTRQMICSEPGKPDQVIEIPVQEPEVPVVVQPNMVAQPVVGAFPGVGGVSGGGSVMPAGPTMHHTTGPQLPPAPGPGAPPVRPVRPVGPTQPTPGPNIFHSPPIGVPAPPLPGPTPPGPPVDAPMPTAFPIDCDQLHWHFSRVLEGRAQPEEMYFQEWRGVLGKAKIDPAWKWFLMRRSADMYHGKWTVHERQKDSFIVMADRVCRGGGPEPVPGPTDVCDWYAWAMEMTMTDWLNMPMWVELYNETARLFMNTRVARAGHELDSERWKRQAIDALDSLQECFNNGGWVSTEKFDLQLRRGLELCEAEDKKWTDSGLGFGKDKSKKKIDRCSRMLMAMLSIQDPATLPSITVGADQAHGFSLGNEPMGVPRWLEGEMIGFFHTLPVEVKRTVETILRKFINQPRSLSQHEFKTLAQFLYKACKGRLGQMPDELCARIDFYLILDYYSGGLAETEWTELYDDLVPQIMDTATTREQDWIFSFMVDWRAKRLQDQRPPVEELNRFRSTINEICMRKTNVPFQGGHRTDDYCQKLVKGIQNLADNRLSQADAQAVVTAAEYTFESIEDEVAKEVAYAAIRHLYAGKHLNRPRLEGLKQYVYAHCKGTEGEWQNLCVQLDYLILGVSMTGLHPRAAEFLVGHAMTFVPKIPVREDERRARDLLEAIRRDPSQPLVPEDEDWLRNQIWDACMQEDIGGLKLGLDEEPVEPHPSGERGVKPEVHHRPTYPVGADYKPGLTVPASFEDVVGTPIIPEAVRPGGGPRQLRDEFPDLTFNPGLSQTHTVTHRTDPLTAYNRRPGSLDRRLGRAKQGLQRLIRGQRKNRHKRNLPPGAMEGLLKQIVDQRQLIGRLKQAGAKEHTMEDFTWRGEMTAIMETEDDEEKRLAHILNTQGDAGHRQIDAEIERLKALWDERGTAKGYIMEMNLGKVFVRRLHHAHRQKIAALRNQGLTDEQIASQVQAGSQQLMQAEQLLNEVWTRAIERYQWAMQRDIQAKLQEQLNAATGDRDMRGVMKQLRRNERKLRQSEYDSQGLEDKTRAAMERLRQLGVQIHMAEAQVGRAASIHGWQQAPAASNQDLFKAWIEAQGFTIRGDGQVVEPTVNMVIPMIRERWKRAPENPERLREVPKPRPAAWQGKTYAELAQLAQQIEARHIAEQGWVIRDGRLVDDITGTGVRWSFHSSGLNPLRGVVKPKPGEEHLPAIWVPDPHQDDTVWITADEFRQREAAQKAHVQAAAAVTGSPNVRPPVVVPNILTPPAAMAGAPAPGQIAGLQTNIGRIQRRGALDAALQRANQAAAERIARQQAQQAGMQLPPVQEEPQRGVSATPEEKQSEAATTPGGPPGPPGPPGGGRPAPKPGPDEPVIPGTPETFVWPDMITLAQQHTGELQATNLRSAQLEMAKTVQRGITTVKQNFETILHRFQSALAYNRYPQLAAIIQEATVAALQYSSLVSYIAGFATLGFTRQPEITNQLATRVAQFANSGAAEIQNGNQVLGMKLSQAEPNLKKMTNGIQLMLKSITGALTVTGEAVQYLAFAAQEQAAEQARQQAAAANQPPPVPPEPATADEPWTYLDPALVNYKNMRDIDRARFEAQVLSRSRAGTPVPAAGVAPLPGLPMPPGLSPMPRTLSAMSSPSRGRSASVSIDPAVAAAMFAGQPLYDRGMSQPAPAGQVRPGRHPSAPASFRQPMAFGIAADHDPLTRSTSYDPQGANIPLGPVRGSSMPHETFEPGVGAPPDPLRGISQPLSRALAQPAPKIGARAASVPSGAEAIAIAEARAAAAEAALASVDADLGLGREGEQAMLRAQRLLSAQPRSLSELEEKSGEQDYGARGSSLSPMPRTLSAMSSPSRSRSVSAIMPQHVTPGAERAGLGPARPIDRAVSEPRDIRSREERRRSMPGRWDVESAAERRARHMAAIGEERRDRRASEPAQDAPRKHIPVSPSQPRSQPGKPKKPKPKDRGRSMPVLDPVVGEPRSRSVGWERPEFPVPAGIPSLEEEAGRQGLEDLAEEDAPAGDPCDEVVYAIRALMRDFESGAKRQRVIDLCTAIGARAQGTSAKGRELMDKVKDPVWNAKLVGELQDLAWDLCKLWRASGAKVGPARKYWKPTRRKDLEWGGGPETVDKTLNPWHAPEDVEFIRKLVADFKGTDEEMPGAVSAAYEYDELTRIMAKYADYESKEFTETERAQHSQTVQRRRQLASRYGFQIEVPSAWMTQAKAHRQAARIVARDERERAITHTSNASKVKKAVKGLDRDVKAGEKSLKKMRRAETSALKTVSTNQKGRPTKAKAARIKKATDTARDLSSAIAEGEAKLSDNKSKRARLEGVASTELEAAADSRKRQKLATKISRATKNADPAVLDKLAKGLRPGPLQSAIAEKDAKWQATQDAVRQMKAGRKRKSLQDEVDDADEQERIDKLKRRKGSSPPPLPVSTDFSDLPRKRREKREYKQRLAEVEALSVEDAHLRAAEERAEEERFDVESVARQTAIKDFWKNAKKSTKVASPLLALGLETVGDTLSADQIRLIVDILLDVFGRKRLHLKFKADHGVTLQKKGKEFVASLSRKRQVKYSDLANLAKIAGIASEGGRIEKLQTSLSRRSRVQATRSVSPSTSMPRMLSRSVQFDDSGSESRSRSATPERGRDRERDTGMDKTTRARSKSPGRRSRSPGGRRLMI